MAVEIAVKNPRSFWEMTNDVRQFAERAPAPSTERSSTPARISDRTSPDDPRLAA